MLFSEELRSSGEWKRKIEDKKVEYFHILSQLIAFPTVSPPARNTRQAQQYVADYLRRLGMEVDQWEIYPSDDNVVGRWRGTGGGRSLILNGHIDVASVAEDEGWHTPPFTLTVKDGRLYGRGVADMKGGLASGLFALALLKESGFVPKGDILFQSVIGEEVGEAGTQACVQRGYTADFAIVMDSSQMQIQGQGGVITGWIEIRSPQTFHDGMRAKLIHAGGRQFGASAIEKMVKVISALQELERHWAVMKSYPGFPPGMNTINPAVIEGGRHPAFVADQCRLWITVHFYPNETYESVAKEVEEHVLRMAAADPWLSQHPPRFRWGGSSMIEDRGEIFPALEVDWQHPGVRLLSQVHEEVSGLPAVHSMSSTVTDAGWLGRAGIPTVLYGPGSLEQAHAVNESIEWAELLQYTQTLVRFIEQWCG